MEKRIKEIAEIAQENFWESVAEEFPEIKTGDFPPMATIVFDSACESAVKIWYESNKKE